MYLWTQHIICVQPMLALMLSRGSYQMCLNGKSSHDTCEWSGLWERGHRTQKFGTSGEFTVFLQSSVVNQPHCGSSDFWLLQLTYLGSPAILDSEPILQSIIYLVIQPFMHPFAHIPALALVKHFDYGSVFNHQTILLQKHFHYLPFTEKEIEAQRG